MTEEKNFTYSVLMSIYQKDNPEWFEIAAVSMLVQTISPFELVLVEDGLLTPELYKAIDHLEKEYAGKIRRIPLKENQGLGLALQRGVEECCCEWIARMDSDDYARPDRIEKQLDAIRRQEVDIVGSDVYEFREELSNVTSIRAFPEMPEDLRRFARRKTPFAHPSVLMRKSCVLKVGNYTAAYLHEDYDLFLRMLVNGCKGYTVKEPLVSVRVSDSFYTRRSGLSYLSELLRFNWKIYRKQWVGISDFLIRSTGNILVCLLPNRLRIWFYKNCLRVKQEVYER